MIQRFTWTMTSAAVLLGANPAAMATPAFAPAVTAQIEAAWKTSRMPGLCAVTVDRDGITAAAALGWSDVAARRPYRLDTLQPVGSVSKTTIGYALALLSTRALLDLDEPIDRWLPYAVRNPRFAQQPITLRQLATHTSGIVDRPAAYRQAYTSDPARSMSMQQFVQQYFTAGGSLFSSKNFGTTAPGGRFEYSNLGAALAAVTIEHRTGVSFAEFTRDSVFAPLGMVDSGWSATGDERAATLYKASGKPWPSYSVITYADGGLRSSCADLARYAIELLRAAAGMPSKLDVAAVRAMLSAQFAANAPPSGIDPSEPNQGLFWQHRRSGGIGHSGSDPGISAFLLLQPEIGRAQILLTNCGVDESPRFAAAFRQIWALMR